MCTQCTSEYLYEDSCLEIGFIHVDRARVMVVPEDRQWGEGGPGDHVMWVMLPDSIPYHGWRLQFVVLLGVEVISEVRHVG